MSTATATPQDAHQRYMQAASKLARIAILEAELPVKRAEAEAELMAAIEAYGADPLGLAGKRSNGNRAPNSVRDIILRALPGKVDEIARRTGVNNAHVNTTLRKMLAEGRVVRTGDPGRGRLGGYVYHRAEDEG